MEMILPWIQENWAIVAIIVLLLSGGDVGALLAKLKEILPKPVDPTPPSPTPPTPVPVVEPVTPSRIDKLLEVIEKILPLIPVIISIVPKAKDADK